MDRWFTPTNILIAFLISCVLTFAYVGTEGLVTDGVSFVLLSAMITLVLIFLFIGLDWAMDRD